MYLAQCHEVLGQLENAKKTYERLLKIQLDVKQKRVVEQRLAAIVKRLKEPKEIPPKQEGKETKEETKEETKDGEVTIDLGDGDMVAGLSGGEKATGVDVDVASGLISGWYRTSLDVDMAHDRPSGPTDLSEDSLELRNRLLLRLDVRYGTTLQAFAAVLLDHVVRETPPDGDEFFWLFNGSDYRAEFEASLIETFLNISLGRFDVRLGMLRLSWGKFEYNSPNDVLNPFDLRNPYREELEILRLPVLAAEVQVNLSPVTLELIWQPLFRANKQALYGSDYGILMSPTLPLPVRGLVRMLDSLSHPTVSSKLEEFLLQTELPPDNLLSSSFGLRAAAQIKGLDFSLYYHYGWDPSVRLSINPFAMNIVGQIDWSRAQVEDLGPLLDLVDAGMTIYRGDYIRRHHAGADFATAMGSFVLRGEVGFDSRRVFRDTTMVPYALDAVAVNLGAEYQHDMNKSVMLEAGYLAVFGAPENLLFDQPHSVDIAAMIRWSFLDHDLLIEVWGTVGFRPWQYVARPRVSYKLSKRWWIHGGVVVLGGDEESLGGYYDRNDIWFLEATCNL